MASGMLKFKGDARGVDPALYATPLTLAQAQALVDRLRPLFQTPAIRVERGRTTRRRWGHAKTLSRGWPLTALSVVLHPPRGLNVGTLLHEFAHHVSPRTGHGPAFKRAHLDVIAAYRELQGA